MRIPAICAALYPQTFNSVVELNVVPCVLVVMQPVLPIGMAVETPAPPDVCETELMSVVPPVAAQFAHVLPLSSVKS